MTGVVGAYVKLLFVAGIFEAYVKALFVIGVFGAYAKTIFRHKHHLQQSVDYNGFVC